MKPGKAFMKIRIIAVAVFLVLLLALTGCGGGTFYKVTQTETGNIYYSKDVKMKEAGVVVFNEAGSGKKVKLEKASVQIISSEEFKAALSSSIYIDNQITSNSARPCIYVKPQGIVSLFNPYGQEIGPGKSGPYVIPNGQFGLQVNFWYWAQTPYQDHAIGTWDCSDIGKGTCHNPDNSGGQFVMGKNCTIASMSPPMFGVGKETYIIADVSAGMDGSGHCVVTIKPNQHTACVTPGCCDYGLSTSGKCKDGKQGSYDPGCKSPPP
jgi:hypothetical protein